MKKTIWLPALLLYFVFAHQAKAQERTFKQTSITAGFGLGINDGARETGNGLFYLIGWQKSLGKKQKLRINPHLLLGEMAPLAITDVRQQYYRNSLLGFDAHYDLIRYKAVSIVTTGGVFLNYARGLLGTGGRRAAHRSEYFYDLYFGGKLSLGLRINPRRGKVAYEIRPFNIYLGTKRFFMGYLMFSVNFKLLK